MLIVSALLLVGSSVFGFLNKGALADKQTEIASAKAASATAQTDVSKAKADQKKAESAKSEAEGKANDLQTQLAAANDKAKGLQDASDAAAKNLTDAQAKVADLTQKLAATPTAATPAAGRYGPFQAT